MGKQFKRIKPKAKYVIPLVAITSLLGVSYGYWSDSLQVSADIETGRLMVQGREIYPKQGNNLPIHRQGDHVCYMEGISGFRTSEVESKTLQYGTMSSRLVKCDKKNHNNLWCTCTYDVEVEFQVINTGTTDAYIKLNKSPDNGYEQTWFRTIQEGSESPEWDAERDGQNGKYGKNFENSIMIDEVIQKDGIKKNVGQLLNNEKGYKLGVGESIKCSFEIRGVPKIKVNKSWYYEVQVGIKSSTGEYGTGWQGSTCNNVFIKPRISQTMTQSTLFELEQIELLDQLENEIMLLPLPGQELPVPEGPNIGDEGASQIPVPLPLPAPELPVETPEEPTEGTDSTIQIPVPLPLPEVDLPIEIPEETSPESENSSQVPNIDIVIKEETEEANPEENIPEVTKQSQIPQGGENQ